MKYWIIADTHFYHKLLINIGDRKEGYEKKLQTHLLQIPEEDTLIHLGDICIGFDAKVHDEFIKPLKCKKILVKGNHDGKSNQWYTEHGWDFVCDSITIKKYNKEVLLIHIPTDETKEWADKKQNRVIIHGHWHTFKRFDRGVHPLEKHILYSCEYETMMPRTMKYMLEKK